jgi:putative addiction module killer protein
MYEVLQTSAYAAWFRSLRDRTARGLIVRRVERLQLGNFGDAKSLGDGVHELRLNFGPGYRVYFAHRAGRIVLLLCGGDKGGQQRDISRAKQLATELE